VRLAATSLGGSSHADLAFFRKAGVRSTGPAAASFLPLSFLRGAHAKGDAGGTMVEGCFVHLSMRR
jgi:hypothetical protein